MWRLIVRLWVMSSTLLASHVSPRQEEEEGRIWTEPQDSSDGGFIFPVTYPTDFREGSSINISWSTTYENINLYFYQRGKVANSVQLAVNLASQWYQWEVRAEETNLTNPFVFRVVNAQGTDEEQRIDGFWSTSWYIKRTGVASESEAFSSSSSSLSLSTSSVTLDPVSSPPTTSSTSPSSTTSATDTLATVASDGVRDTEDKGIGKNTIIGMTVGLVVAGILIIVGVVFCLRKRRKDKTASTPAPAPAVSYVDNAPAQKQSGYHAAHEVLAPPSELQGAPPLYELPGHR